MTATTLDPRSRATDPDGIIRRTLTLTSPAARAVATTPSDGAGTAGVREFDAIGVPWGETIDVGGWWRERFEPGSVDDAGAVLFWRHREVIGTIPAASDTDAGRKITGRVADTTAGRDAITLVDAGAVRAVSIGFIGEEYRVENAGTPDEVIVWTKVRALEYSLVPHPAYQSAAITEIRSRKGATIVAETDTLTRADLTAELRSVDEKLTEHERALAAMRAQAAAGDGHNWDAIGAQWRSMGQYVKAVAAGDETAAEFHRAYTSGVIADAAIAPTFLGDYIKLVDERRRIVDLFTRGPLPDQGSSVDYRQLKTNSITVGKQAAEGDPLPGPGRIVLERKNAPVETIGGWWEMSRQEIERGTGAELSTAYRAGAIAYAKATNARVRDTFLATVNDRLALAAGGDTTAALTLAANATTDAWLSALVDGVEIMDDRGFEVTGLGVSKDVFKMLLNLKDGDGTRLMNVYGQGMNMAGEMTIPGLGGNLAGIRVAMMGGVTGNTAALFDRVAIEFLEAPGSPAHLQDANVINLTQQFSLYGYCATIVPFPSAIVPVKIG